jgi:hypothetical protein
LPLPSLPPPPLPLPSLPPPPRPPHGALSWKTSHQLLHTPHSRRDELATPQTHEALRLRLKI